MDAVTPHTVLHTVRLYAPSQGVAVSTGPSRMDLSASGRTKEEAVGKLRATIDTLVAQLDEVEAGT